MKLIEAVRFENIELAKKLINEGYTLNNKDGYDRTALMYASYHGYIEIVKELIKDGASLNDIDIYGNKAFDFNTFIWRSYEIQDLILNMYPHLYSLLEDNVGIHKDILLKLKMKQILDV